ncbi:DNA annealing helicase and endonuclease ZRANB3 isoform X2 [Eleutherodactylus coqui]|uniref:DNA annealing helicase and endonuclease ZRANB3 isoform X2 n=1 Tax=Eleutherodactylus coqui TaxID=57060 RepID=UPI0034627874
MEKRRVTLEKRRATQEERRVTREEAAQDVADKLSGLPERLRERLLPFQREGVLFALQRQGRCMIADEMGLGKTLQAIAVAYCYREEWPLLIVVPSSLKYPWIEEMEKWIPELGPEDITVIENKTDVGRIATSQVTVLGYGLLTADARVLTDALYRQHFKVVLVDESHYMKSRNASRSKLLLPIVQKASRALLLTGTPALGRPEELYMQVHGLFPGRFGTWTEYAKKYCNAHVRYFGNRTQWDYRGASNLDDLHQRLSSIMVRRLKNEVLTQLPPKIRQRIPFDLPKDKVKEMSASIEDWEKLMRCPESLSSDSGSPFGQVMGMITHLYKQTALAKAGAVKDYIKMMLENEKLKFLVFGHHLSMLQACTEAAIESKARYIRIDGSVPSAERIHLVHQFQNDPDTRVAILSIQAAGQGLTFTAAAHVVFAELYWDPGHIKQAEDRAHRIGQSSSVHIHYLIAKGTLDTLMWGMLNRKAKVTGSTLNGKKEKIQAEEDDKEKWDFLSFAKSWTPNEELDETRGQLFTHFEKDKQHDIRSFFSADPENKRKKIAGEEGETSDNAAEANVLADRRDIVDVDALYPDEDSEQQPKRFRPSGSQTPKSIPKSASSAKRKSWGVKPSSLFSSSTTRVLSESALLTPPRPVLTEKQWSCAACTYTNSPLLPYCEICDSPRSRKGPEIRPPPVSVSCIQGEKENELRSDVDNELMDCPPQQAPPARQSVLEGDDSLSIQNSILEAHPREESAAAAPEPCPGFPLYDGLMFCASRHTDRIYLYSKILRFVREWNSLTAMKQRLIRKSGRMFSSPAHAAAELSKQHSAHSSTRRYLTREDVAAASLSKVQSTGGSVRLVSREPATAAKEKASLATAAGPPTWTKDAASSPDATGDGYLQALDGVGNPLCLYCQGSCPQVAATAWDNRFCSRQCHEEFLIRSSQSYMRAKVFETERGVCQQCCLNAHELFLSVRDAPVSQRKGLLEGTWMAQLPLQQLNELIRNPSEGDFWQADHIRPVYSGGGQCALDNLQTLCTVCHRERTACQAKERSRSKKRSMASKYGSDITKFFTKA